MNRLLARGRGSGCVIGFVLKRGPGSASIHLLGQSRERHTRGGRGGVRTSSGGFLLPDGARVSAGRAPLPGWRDVGAPPHPALPPTPSVLVPKPWPQRMSRGSLGGWLATYSGSQKNGRVCGGSRRAWNFIHLLNSRL